MKFWWLHNEVVITTLLAYLMTGSEKYAQSLPSPRCKPDTKRQVQFVKALSIANAKWHRTKILNEHLHENRSEERNVNYTSSGA